MARMRFAAGHDLPDAKALNGAGKAWAEMMGVVVATVGRGAGYDTGGLPMLSPETWRQYREHQESNRQHHPADCTLCAFWAEADLSLAISPYRDGPALLLPDRPRWGSAESALEHYWAVVQDGYPSGSVTGSIVAFGKLGCWTQQSSRDGSVAERLADDVAAVEGALRYAFRATVSWRHYAAILLARRGCRVEIEAVEVATAMGLRSSDIGAIVRTGMRGVRANLAARGLIPLPRAGSRARIEAAELLKTIHEARARL